MSKEEPKKPGVTPFGDITNKNYQEELDAFWMSQNISNAPQYNGTFAMNQGFPMNSGQNQAFMNPMLLKQYQMMQAGYGNMQFPTGGQFVPK